MVIIGLTVDMFRFMESFISEKLAVESSDLYFKLNSGTVVMTVARLSLLVVTLSIYTVE